MIYHILISLVLLAVTTFAASAQDSSVLKTDKAKLSYSMGVSTAKNMKRFSEIHTLDLDTALIEKGVRDGFAGKEMLLTEKEIQEVLAGLQKKLTEKQQAEREKLIKKFDQDEDVQLLNGRYGPYLVIKKQNFKLPKGVDPSALSLEECYKISEDPKNMPKKRFVKKKK
ncbi:MAG: hypothetical protein COZ08_10810 [Bacteroidetes bacterium CG_4_10_14_3_um_filter_42_6]|nr:MAG: hypothetical protein COZ08_10810 [Bacteroidetes bacterium CG_4_10_14_3_um_filter_42_6]